MISALAIEEGNAFKGQNGVIDSDIQGKILWSLCISEMFLYCWELKFQILWAVSGSLAVGSCNLMVSKYSIATITFLENAIIFYHTLVEKGDV